MPKPYQPPPPVIDYATPSADRVPELVPEVEHLIDGRAPIDRLRKFFSSSGQALAYFTRSMKRRYSVAKLNLTCVGCGHHPVDTYAYVRWVARATPNTLELRLGTATEMIETAHSLCPDCLKSIRNRIAVPRLVGCMAAASLTVTFLLLVAYLMARRQWFERFDRQHGMVVWLGATGAMVFILILWIGAAAIERRALPVQIKGAMPRGVEFEGLSGPHVRELPEARANV